MNEFVLFLNNIEFNWTIIESLAVFFSIIYVILAARQNIWCWASAIISVSLYIYICYTAQLFAETGLQIFYLLMAFYGYYNWGKTATILKITEWSIKKHLLILIFGAILTFFIGFCSSNYTSAKMPIVDSLTTVFAKPGASVDIHSS